MKVLTDRLTRPGATLTGYLQDRSPELRTADVRPAILVLPGGGYFMCSDREAEPIALAYLAEGYHAFVLRYTVGEGEVFPEALADAEEALDRINSNAAEWGIDATRVAVIGFSAGGHLAASLGTMGRIRPAALILGYPCILASMGAALGKTIPSVDEHVDSATPPVFIFQTADDATVPAENALAFAAALGRAGVPYELHVFATGSHGLSLARPLTANGKAAMVEPRVADWLPLSAAWLRATWGDYPADEVQDHLFPARSRGLRTPLRQLLEVPGARAILAEAVPELLAQLEANALAGGASLALIAHHVPDQLTTGILKSLDEAFLAVEAD
jgi:acetyl esterase/lipase